MSHSLKAELADIEPVSVNVAELEAATSEDPFMAVAVDLMVEVGSYTCVAAHIYPSGSDGWTRNQAIVGGHLVRLFKLIDAMLDQTCKHRMETMMIFGRLAFETIVNLKFLCTQGRDEIFQSYIQYSMRHEKKLYNTIKSRISERACEILPIETRMLASIDKQAALSGVDLATVKPSSPKNWADKNLFEKAEVVGLAEAYLAAFGGASHNVHGNWMDILEHHVTFKNGFFHPAGHWSNPRPQVLLAMAKLTIEALDTYFNYLGHLEVRAEMHGRLDDVLNRIFEVDRLHEAYLRQQMKTTDAR
jgi:hypothetical protein